MTIAMLLKGGTVLIHDVIDNVKAIKADVLIEGNEIKKIEAGVSAPADVQVIDCSNKILSPGFIDTHHHVWNTQLRGRHANQLVLEYSYAGQSKAWFSSIYATSLFSLPLKESRKAPITRPRTSSGANWEAAWRCLMQEQQRS